MMCDCPGGEVIYLSWGGGGGGGVKLVSVSRGFTL